MDLRLETAYSSADLLGEVEELKKKVDALRPLPENIEGKVLQKLRLDWNYHSNAIEGNQLNYGETVAFLMEGITAKGKPLKDHLDIRGHNEAINFLLAIVKETRPLTEADIRSLHQMVLVEPYRSPAQTADGLPTTKQINPGEYKTSANHVQTSTGETHYYATPEETPAKMQELMEWFNEVRSNNQISPIVTAAMFHHKFVAIHPFDDGNGRLSRILMNLVLMQSGYPPVVIKMDDRQNYYALLSRADKGDNRPFIEYIAEQLEKSLRIYLRAAKGEDIDEDEDIEKEIALLRMEMSGNINIEEKRTVSIIKTTLTTEIDPLFQNLCGIAKNFEEFFLTYTFIVKIQFGNDAVTRENSKDFLMDFVATTTDTTLDNITRLSLIFSYHKFRNAENNFDSNYGLLIDFKDYAYEMLNFNGQIILIKPYHEKLISDDIKKIRKTFIDSVKEKFKSDS